MKFINKIYLLILLLSSISYSQIPNFTLDVAVIDETCTNNGSLQMTVTNTAAGSTIIYELFLAPNFSTPIAETMNNSFSGLAGGSYRIIATQTKGGFSNSQQKNVNLADLVDPLDFDISDSATIDCGLSATLVVNVLSGNPTFFEIIAGPEIRPLQTSNEFVGLLSGTYMIRVFDDCNDAVSKEYTFVVGSNVLTIGAPSLPEIYTSCNSLTLTNNIVSTNGLILYPLIVNYTITGPGGSTNQNFTQNITSGPTDILNLIQDVSLYGNATFTVKIQISDNCGNNFESQFTVDPSPKISVQKETGECGALFFKISVKNYFPPFTLNFTQPGGFNAAAFNADYPGPYSSSPITFGTITNTAPFGDYKVTVQGGCGRTKDLEFTLVKKEIKPDVTKRNNGCGSEFGYLKIKMPNNQQIVSITMIQAPASYTGVLPQNLSTALDSQGVYLNTNLPIGEYIFEIVDNCGESHTITVEIPAFVFGELVSEVRASCSPIYGSVKLSTTNGKLVTVVITAAPPAFEQATPHDVSYNINADGFFYMSDLPLGIYTFTATDACGFVQTATVEILGYNSSSNGFSLNRKCGSFDITIEDTDESITGKSFWLQKFFPETGTWGHPTTGAPFTEGAFPTATTAMSLGNNATLANLFLIGDFRVIKMFQTFSNGSPDAQCSDLYSSFTINAQLVISGAYNLSCNADAGADDVIIDAEGAGPFNFQITSPFNFDNGENNIFTDLEEGVYNFRVTDDCGNVKNISIEVRTLITLTVANTPQSMLVCRTDGVQFGVFPLIEQNAQILGNQNPNKYNVTYHLTQADADAGTNPLPAGYANISNPQMIYARVQYKTYEFCYATTSFKIFAGLKPKLSPEIPVYLCEGFSKTLTAEPGFSSYEWSTGETTPSITVSDEGIYTVTVKNIYEDFSCDNSKNFVVTMSNKATFQDIDTSDWTSSDNSVVVLVIGLGNYSYSLDNINFQTSNTFHNLLPGIYTVYVKDENGCGSVNEDFVLLNYPKFFTPNGDGYNDTWQVQLSNLEPSMDINIFDRYGRYITNIRSGEDGWDGTYNGSPLPSTDYWFAITREDGKIYRGHFTLKR